MNRLLPSSASTYAFRNISSIVASRSLGSKSTTSPTSSSSSSSQSSQSQSQSSAPSAESLKPRSAGRQWSVLPFSQSRTKATSRLWNTRYDPETANTAPDSTSTKSGIESPPLRKIVPKRMKDSAVQVYLPFKSDQLTREDYVNFYNGVRLSKVLEDLDALAGSVAYLHADDGNPETEPLLIVTASVDRIDLLQPLSINEDYRLTGYVTHVGTSSMEVSIMMETTDHIPLDHEVDAIGSFGHYSYLSGPSPATPQDPTSAPSNPRGKPILVAKFSMVARDPVTNKASRVNPLLLVTEEERRIYQFGAQTKTKKSLLSQMSLENIPPTTEELASVHTLWKEYSKYLTGTPMPDSTVWMSSTFLSNVQLCMPQDRNIHGKVFGGYLMKLAYELAYSTALVFSKSRPLFSCMDDITFRKPVPIGSLLRLESSVVYSRGGDGIYQIQVIADVLSPTHSTRDTTNIFQFTFQSADPLSIPRVLPKSYDESMKYLAGRRCLENARERKGWVVDVLGLE